MRNKRGFTLVEVVVVIAVISILAAVTVPSVLSVVGSARKSSDIQTMHKLNSMLSVGELSAAELKDDYDLQTEGWELAYSKSVNKLVILGSDNKIVAAWKNSLVGLDGDGYIRLSQLTDDPDIPVGPDDPEEQAKQKFKDGAYVVDSLPPKAEELKTLNENGKLYLSDDINELPKEYFYGCEWLTSIYLGTGITVIPQSAFNGCKSLKEVYIAGQVTEIGDYAFKKCPITELILPSSLQAIGWNTFNGCKFDSLTMPCVEIKDNPQGNLQQADTTTKNLVLTGGSIAGSGTNYFSSWLDNLFNNSITQKALASLKITNVTIDDASIFDCLKDYVAENMTISIDRFSYDSIKGGTSKQFFEQYLTEDILLSKIACIPV